MNQDAHLYIIYSFFRFRKNDLSPLDFHIQTIIEYNNKFPLSIKYVYSKNGSGWNILQESTA